MSVSNPKRDAHRVHVRLGYHLHKTRKWRAITPDHTRSILWAITCSVTHILVKIPDLSTSCIPRTSRRSESRPTGQNKHNPHWRWKLASPRQKSVPSPLLTLQKSLSDQLQHVECVKLSAHKRKRRHKNIVLFTTPERCRAAPPWLAIGLHLTQNVKRRMFLAKMLSVVTVRQCTSTRVQSKKYFSDIVGHPWRRPYVRKVRA